MYRRDLLKQTGATAATIAAPAFIGPITLGSSETLTKLATANGTQIQSYGDGNPSFIPIRDRLGPGRPQGVDDFAGRRPDHP